MATRKNGATVYQRAGRWFARLVVDGRRVSVPLQDVTDEVGARAAALRLGERSQKGAA